MLRGGTKMGTRSIITFKGDGNTFCSVYQQFDGYPDGVGLDLANFLKSKKLVNGISGDGSKVFNGAGCLIAQYIAAHKSKAGGLYITTPEDNNEEYNYVVDIKHLTWGDELTPEHIMMSCDDIKGGELMTVDDFINAVN